MQHDVYETPQEVGAGRGHARPPDSMPPTTRRRRRGSSEPFNVNVTTAARAVCRARNPKLAQPAPPPGHPAEGLVQHQLPHRTALGARRVPSPSPPPLRGGGRAAGRRSGPTSTTSSPNGPGGPGGEPGSDRPRDREGY